MNKLNKLSLALGTIAAVLALGATSASAKAPHSKKTVYQGPNGGTLIVKKQRRGNFTKTTVVKRGPQGRFLGRDARYGQAATPPAHSNRFDKIGKMGSPRVTRYEQRKIDRSFDKLLRMQAKFFADGFLTPRESRLLNKQQRKLQRVIRLAYLG